MLIALAPVKYPTGWQIDSVDIVSAEDVQPNDSRVFVAREADVDWVAEAIEAHLNSRQVAQEGAAQMAA